MRVLVVEDDPLIRADLGDALTAAGFLAESCGDGTRAISSLSAAKFS